MSMAEAAAFDNLEELTEMAEGLETFVRQAAVAGTAAHEVEREVWQRVLAMGRQATGHFFQMQGDGDVGETIEMTDGETLRRLDEPHRRSYRSIFGSFTLSRYVYGTSSARPNRIQVRSQIDIAAIHFLPAVIASEARNVI